MEFFFGEHHLDIDRRELRRDARLIAVEPQVFDLLVYLVQNRDRVVSKDDLIATVWRGRIVSESTITSHIHSARKAVGDSGEAQRLIRTLPRKGFRFIGAVHEEPLAAPSRHSPFDLSGKAPSAVRSEATGPTSSAAMPVTPATPPGLVTEDPPGALLALPDKPSIAVLPFANLSRDLGQEYFAYGIAEDIITALSRYPSLFVIARYSSFAYKGRAVDAKQVGRKLGARYILEGSLRKSGNRIRVTAQVVETETGKHVWAERYDRELANIFAVQDNITEAVTTAIAPAIAAAERQRAMRMLPGSFNAWTAYQHGLWHVFKISREHDALAQKYFQQAIDIDPAFAGGYKGLAWVHIQAAGVHGTCTLPEACDSAEALARQAIALDPTDAEAHLTLSQAMLYSRGDYEGASAEAEIARAISPNLALAHGTLGEILIFSGRPKEGLAPVQTAIRLDFRDPKLANRFNNLAVARYFSSEYEAAVEAAKRAVRANPHFPMAYRWLAAALGQLGRTAEAKEALKKAIAIAPASFDMYVRRRVPWHRPEDHAHMLEGLRKASMPSK